MAVSLCSYGGPRRPVLFADPRDSKPTLITAIEDCVYSLMWFTAAACPQKSNVHGDCKVTNPVTGHLFDLNGLNKVGGFAIHETKGTKGKLTHHVCGGIGDKRSGDESDEKIYVNYSKGDDVCGKGIQAKTNLQLECANTFGTPTLLEVNEEKCEFWLFWKTRAACSVKPQEVKVVDGTITIPATGVSLNLGDIFFRLYNASGDIRPNGDKYAYEIQLSGITHSSIKACIGANICQVKISGVYNRQIGSSSEAKYFVKGKL
ncbi:Cation-independent mannose-6-phosphate receptor [Acipenser ruthenus]|uniref:Cation-independent mannose-6-phosphate receptor n=1 Tax=Acipenser ruthenus TaxID=7906 RepID=A0A662YTZ0_ACIRT|nr:Cation-independent mannose-6-phosphate receptor [Acipenser ruthenus]